MVLAGGGARGAYEAGALAVLLPALEARGERPRVVVGTSVGALNAGYLAAKADRPVDEVAAEGQGVWRDMRYGEVLTPLLSGGTIERGLRYLAEVLGIGDVQLPALLDPPRARHRRGRHRRRLDDGPRDHLGRRPRRPRHQPEPRRRRVAGHAGRREVRGRQASRRRGGRGQRLRVWQLADVSGRVPRSDRGRRGHCPRRDGVDRRGCARAGFRRPASEIGLRASTERCGPCAPPSA